MDDEPALRRSLARILERFEIVTADDGSEAMELLKTDAAFDAVVCDLMMPSMTGVELHRWLSEANPPLARRMVFASGGTFTAETGAFLKETGQPVLLKPFKLADVRRQVGLMVGLTD